MPTTLAQRLEAFEALRQRLLVLDEDTLDTLYWKNQNQNAWFVPASTQHALQGLISYLAPQALADWAGEYRIPADNAQAKTIGVIMAGNIPLVGVHDFICVLVAGHTLRAKLSSQDAFLLKEIAGMLIEEAPYMAPYIIFEERMNGVDALIATGSDNSARYFEYYFRDTPHIIRKNRGSVAVLTGEERPEELAALGIDICRYFGLGCRNVSKLYVPEGYDFKPLLYALEAPIQQLMEMHKYANNYDYNKSIMLINQVPHLDNGGLMVTESEALISPISVLHYQSYKDLFSLEAMLMGLSDKLQCVVGRQGTVARALPFGQAQHPGIGDYADDVDTMAFLLQQFP